MEFDGLRYRSFNGFEIFLHALARLSHGRRLILDDIEVEFLFRTPFLKSRIIMRPEPPQEDIRRSGPFTIHLDQ